MERKIIIAHNSIPIVALCKSDSRMGELINLVGDYTLVLRTDLFASLARAVIGQQLSVKAAKTIWSRVIDIGGGLKPETLLAADEDILRGAGVSKQKILYLKDLADKVVSGELDLGCLYSLQDGEIIKTLTGVKGIGLWTAQMFLLFSLGRPDVLAPADIGLRRAVKWLYRLEVMPGLKDMERYGERWAPYRSVASLYLWEAINRGLVDGPCQKDVV